MREYTHTGTILKSLTNRYVSEVGDINHHPLCSTSEREKRQRASEREGEREKLHRRENEVKSFAPMPMSQSDEPVDERYSSKFTQVDESRDWSEQRSRSID